MTQNENRIDIPKLSNGKYDLEQLKEHFLKGGLLNESSVIELLQESMKQFRTEPNVVEIQGPTAIHGDYHGMYFDFLHQLDREFDGMSKDEINRVYLGDYIDRGMMACEIVITLCCMKMNNPKRIVMLRGNHECRRLRKTNNFTDECRTKYSNMLHNMFMDLFDHLPLCCVIRWTQANFFCCHGGIPYEIPTIEEINAEDRFQEPPDEGIMSDLLWSDPIDNCFDDPDLHPNWRANRDVIDFVENEQRGNSFFFGRKALDKFLQKNNCIALIRAHECYDDGVHFNHLGYELAGFPKCITVFGVHDYSCDNKSGVVELLKTKVSFMRYVSSGDYQDKYVTNKLLSINIPSLIISHLSRELSAIFDNLLYSYFIPEPTDEELETPIFKKETYQFNELNESKELNEICDIDEIEELNDSDIIERILNARPIEFEFNYDKEISLHDSNEKRVGFSNNSLTASMDLSRGNKSFDLEYTELDLYASIASDQPLRFERKNIRRHRKLTKFPWTFEELKQKTKGKK